MKHLCRCSECPLKNGEPVWPTLANPRAKRRPRLVVIGEAPGRHEEWEGEYFVGPSGVFLNNILGKLGIPRGRLYITNAVKCRPKRTPSPADWRQAIACCSGLLEHELSLLPRTTKTILAYGAKALLATTGKSKIFDWLGAPIPGAGNYIKYDIVSTLHPAAVLRPDGQAYTPTLFIHTQRAWQLATKKLKPWKWPKIITEANADAVAALRSIAVSKLPVGFDVETRGTDPLAAACMCLGLANRRIAVSVPWEPYPAGRHGFQRGLQGPHAGTIRRLVAGILADPDIPKVFQNGPHDILTARRLGLPIENYEFDTLLAHAIVSQGTRHDLGFIAAMEFHAPRWKTEFHATSDEKGTEAFAGKDPEVLRIYNAKDAYMTALLREPLGKRLDDTHNGWDLFKSNYMRNVRIAVEMQARGVRIDQAARKSHRKKLSGRRNRAKWELVRIAKRLGITDYNPRSPRSNAELFFHRLKVKPRFYSEKTNQPSLKEKALTELVIHPNRMVAMASRALLRYRRWHKLVATYVDGLRPDADGIIHPTWKVHGAVTFRWSSADPNMQNIPKQRKGSKLVGLRDMFIPRDGNWIVGADYSQLELRIMAQLAGDQSLIDAYAEGLDVHAQNARDLCRHDDVEGKPRAMAKQAVYGMNYGQDPGALWKIMVIDFPDISLRDCVLMHKRWFSKHHDIFLFQQRTLKMARERGYIEAPLSGHRLYFYGKIDPTKCYNYPIQHTAADIINPAVAAVAEALRWPQESILAQVHDELVLEGPDPIRLAKILIEHMTRTVALDGRTMTYPVDVKASPRSWGHCQEMTLAELKRWYGKEKRKC